MCELLAISSCHPTAVTMSLNQFASHGSDDGGNKDGWGIVYYAEGDIRRYRDVGPAAESTWVDFVEKQEVRSTLFMAHIRHANVGTISLPNTHPFARELGGYMHTFAHNGLLENFADSSLFESRWFNQLGDTDSEWAFCGLLGSLAPLWLETDDIPPIADRLTVIADFAAKMRSLGVANFIYSDGDALFVHADRRIQKDGEIREPGLWLHRQRVRDNIESVRGGGVEIDSPPQRIVMAASVPLMEDDWEPMTSGSLVALRDGEVIPAPTRPDNQG